MHLCNTSSCDRFCDALTYDAATLSIDTTGLVNPQFSISAVEASASQIIGSLHSVDESASPAYIEVHQEQTAAEQESVECVCNSTPLNGNSSLSGLRSRWWAFL